MCGHRQVCLLIPLYFVVSQNNIIILSDSCKRIVHYQFILGILLEYPIKLL